MWDQTQTEEQPINNKKSSTSFEYLSFIGEWITLFTNHLDEIA